MNPGPKRASIACSFCRRRKRRCDGRKPRCRTCRNRDLECDYDDAAPPRIDSTREMETQLPRLEAIETLLGEHSAAIEALSHPPASSSYTPSPTLESNLHGAHSRRSAVISRDDTQLTSAWAANKPESHRVTNEDAPLTIPLRHQTSTSSLLVLPQVRRLVGEYPEEFFFRAEDSRPRSLPENQMDALLREPITNRVPIEKSVADSHLESFFNMVYPYHSFFDQRDVVNRYEQVLDRGLGFDNQSALVLAIIALGATASGPIDSQRQGHAGDVYIRKALRILFGSWALSFSGDILISQALALCAIYYTYTVEPLMAWRLTHMASTNIQQILFRSKDVLSGEAEIQEATRISWVCFIIESDILAEFHQPRSGIELIVDRMTFPNYGSHPSPENLLSLAEISARSLLNRIHHAIFFTDSLTIYTGLARVDTTSGCALQMEPDASLVRVCEELDRQLQAWYESLPEAIKPDLSGDHPGNRPAWLLRLRYWSSKQNIYRPFVIYVTSQSSEKEIEVPSSVLQMCEACLSACRMFILTAGHLLAVRTPYSYSTAQCCISCALVLSIAARSPPLQHLVNDIEMLQRRTMELLKPWAEPGSSLECAFEIACSIYRKQRFLSSDKSGLDGGGAQMFQ